LSQNNIDLKLAPCSYKAAKYAVEHWHYSKSMPAGKTVKIGVWEDNKFIGCVIFSRGANPNIGKPYGLKQTEVCELTRVALNKHETPVTRIIKIAIKILKKTNPNLQLIVSFADMNQNHLGKIYQAGNWIYTGIAKSTPLYYYKGRWIHQRSGFYKGVTKTKKQKDKYRYLYPLTREMKNKILSLAKPYPKALVV